MADVDWFDELFNDYAQNHRSTLVASFEIFSKSPIYGHGTQHFALDYINTQLDQINLVFAKYLNLHHEVTGKITRVAFMILFAMMIAPS